MRIYQLSRHFPREETYALTDQIRRSSRSVCACIAEAWYKRRYPAAFTSKLLDSASEVGETRCWLEFAGLCGFAPAAVLKELDETYRKIVGMLIEMVRRPGEWRV